MKTSLFLLIVGAVLLTRADALPSYASRIPNGLRVSGVDALGHADRTGEDGALDAFGKAFQAAGRKWTVDLCKADSDGDGQTNGEELGDPCCVWTTGATPKFTTGVSNPGDASYKVSATVLTSNACTTPAPMTTTPTPVTTAPAPVTTAPAPVTTAPVPITTAPAPVTTLPPATTTSPSPTTTTPTPPATDKVWTKIPHGTKKPRGHLRCD